MISLSRTPVARARELSFSEIRLARWLDHKLDMAGALSLVKEFGANNVLDAMHRQVLERYESVYSTGETRGEWRPKPCLHTPGGFLRRVLEGWR